MKNSKLYFAYLALALLMVFSIVLLFKRNGSEVNNQGSHGGKMLVDGNIAAEILIVENDKQAHFRVYLYKDKKPLHPKAANLVVILKRFDDEINTIKFAPTDDYLQSQDEIRKPHSFAVTVNLKLDNKNRTWKYQNIEGRITLSPEVIKASGIKTTVAAPGIIEKKLSVIGKISPNGDALSSIYPRFAGVVKEMKKNLGDNVEKGEVIAVVESNESLRSYPITSPITGTIVQKNVIVGEMIKEDKAIYQVADLSTVWADLTLYRKEASLIKKGMQTVVSGDNGKPKESGIIDYISPLGIEDSQTIIARTVLTNKNQEWIPGMYVNATITYLSKKVPVVAEVSALQRWHDWVIVFVKRGNTFEATPIKIGEQNHRKTEIISGLKSGQSYVIANSFLLKAELGKSEAGDTD